MFSAQQPAVSIAVLRVRKALRMPIRCLSGIELMICSVRCRINASSDFRVRRPAAVIRTVAARPSDCAPRTRSTNPRASNLSRTRVMALGVMPDSAARSVSRVPSLETRIRRIAVCLWLRPSQQTSSGPTWPRMRPTLSSSSHHCCTTSGLLEFFTEGRLPQYTCMCQANISIRKTPSTALQAADASTLGFGRRDIMSQASRSLQAARFAVLTWRSVPSMPCRAHRSNVAETPRIGECRAQQLTGSLPVLICWPVG